MLTASEMREGSSFARDSRGIWSTRTTSWRRWRYKVSKVGETSWPRRWCAGTDWRCDAAEGGAGGVGMAASSGSVGGGRGRDASDASRCWAHPDPRPPARWECDARHVRVIPVCDA